MKIKGMVSFRAMMSIFFIHKGTTNDACMKSSKSRKLTFKLKFALSLNCCMGYFWAWEVMIVMLQKFSLCLNNFYMMYVEYLDVLFGENLQGMRFEDLDFKAQKWWFCGQFWVLTEIMILSVSFPFFFPDPFLLKLASLFI